MIQWDSIILWVSRSSVTSTADKKKTFLEALPWLPWLSAHRSDEKNFSQGTNPTHAGKSVVFPTKPALAHRISQKTMANLWYAERVDMFFLTKTRTKQTNQALARGLHASEWHYQKNQFVGTGQQSLGRMPAKLISVPRLRRKITINV